MTLHISLLLLVLNTFHVKSSAVNDESDDYLPVPPPFPYISIEGSGEDSNEDLLSFEVDACSRSSLSGTQRDLILSIHNNLRSSLAFGKQPNKEGKLPSGKNIHHLEWDCELERRLREWLQDCPTRFMPQSKLASSAQLYRTLWTYYEGNNKTEHIKLTLQDWWSQVKRKGLSLDDSLNGFRGSGRYFAWANMAKGKTTRIGCHYQNCPGHKAKSIFSCIYNEKAQCENETIYERGRPCQVDEECTTYPGSKCLVEKGLCLAPRHNIDDGRNEICPENTKMTDVSRIAVLEQHNYYRSRLARGLEFNGEINTTQPGAKHMLKMTYDCELERYAQEWAEHCVFAHSGSRKRPNQGQNLYMISFKSFDSRSLLHKGIEKWWQELAEIGVPGDNVLTGRMWAKKGKLVGHYTQMAWDRTHRIGCAAVSCPKMAYVVCHYGPAGNRRGFRIYEMGEHCSDDTDCPKPFKCLEQEGLCATDE